jgi:hypothetical protein
MGTIDQASYSLTCNGCGARETATAVEYGSNFGSGGWSEFKGVTKFDFTVKEEFGVPQIDSATCKECKKPAVIK